ncbi:MAG TPA: helix-turn-helix transcriptional regulator [Polyangiaceae bacterium]
MATKKKGTKTSRGAVDAITFSERDRGPLTFGRAMSGIRSVDGSTLAQFAKRLGISAQHLSDVEKDRRVVSAERAAAWGRRLGHPPDVLVRLALQREVDAAGLKLRVSVEAA